MAGPRLAASGSGVITRKLEERSQIWKQERLFNQERQRQKGRGKFKHDDDPFPLLRLGCHQKSDTLARRLESAVKALNGFAAAD